MTDQRDQGHPPRKEHEEPKRSPGAYIGNRPANAFEAVAPPNRRDRTGSGPGNRPPGRFGGGGRPPSPSIAPRPDIAQPQPDLPIGRAVERAEDDVRDRSTRTGANAGGEASAEGAGAAPESETSSEEPPTA